ncbi:MAG: hypothetical protein JXR51_03165 [Bacteroidales bacterium]|nr:hypothetical protein [Bacteroidales bacterium]MBN2756151.1 hypothetical protein [Bacteroidales bacterium]
MKKTLTFLFINFIFVMTLSAQTITISSVPGTVEEFITLRNQQATTPEGGAALFMLALKIYNDYPELGQQCLVLSVDKNLLWEGDVYKGYSLSKSDISLIDRQFAGNNKIADAYIKGGNPENSYSVKLPYVYEFTNNAYSGDKSHGEFKVFVKCYGADSPRPINMRKNDKGIWKAASWSSILVGVKVPPASDDL